MIDIKEEFKDINLQLEQLSVTEAKFVILSHILLELRERGENIKLLLENSEEEIKTISAENRPDMVAAYQDAMVELKCFFE